MSFIELELIEELFTSGGKREIIGKLKDGMAALHGERLHRSGEQGKELAETKRQ